MDTNEIAGEVLHRYHIMCENNRLLWLHINKLLLLQQKRKCLVLPPLVASATVSPQRLQAPVFDVYCICLWSYAIIIIIITTTITIAFT